VLPRATRPKELAAQATYLHRDLAVRGYGSGFVLIRSLYKADMRAADAAIPTPAGAERPVASTGLSSRSLDHSSLNHSSV
jgi:hypothetical protein